MPEDAALRMHLCAVFPPAVGTFAEDRATPTVSEKREAAGLDADARCGDSRVSDSAWVLSTAPIQFLASRLQFGFAQADLALLVGQWVQCCIDQRSNLSIIRRIEFDGLAIGLYVRGRIYIVRKAGHGFFHQQEGQLSRGMLSDVRNTQLHSSHFMSQHQKLIGLAQGWMLF